MPLIDALDAKTEDVGLFITWQADPQLPGPVTSTVALSAATFRVDRFEVQSDANGPTSRVRFPLIWNLEDKPAAETFPEAPPGLYSRISITLGGFFANSYELEGTWLDAGKARPFRISDFATVKATCETSKRLEAGGAARIALVLDLEEALAGVDFKRVREINGRLELANGDPQLPKFRERLRDAFHISD
ncbi:MAG: hypothetical protein H7138_17230 [Myxococcales bacterium]|nr:hypothetical protein [Myxococcales bacterium]